MAVEMTTAELRAQLESTKEFGERARLTLIALDRLEKSEARTARILKAVRATGNDINEDDPADVWMGVCV